MTRPSCSLITSVVTTVSPAKDHAHLLQKEAARKTAKGGKVEIVGGFEETVSAPMVERHGV